MDCRNGKSRVVFLFNDECVGAGDPSPANMWLTAQH